jgi:hypothetical protein
MNSNGHPELHNLYDKVTADTGTTTVNQNCGDRGGLHERLLTRSDI